MFKTHPLDPFKTIQAWSDLAAAQSRAAQTCFSDAIQALTAAQEPQAALAVMKASAERCFSLAGLHAKTAEKLLAGQFEGAVEAVDNAQFEACLSAGKALRSASAALQGAKPTAVNG